MYIHLGITSQLHRKFVLVEYKERLIIVKKVNYCDEYATELKATADILTCCTFSINKSTAEIHCAK